MTSDGITQFRLLTSFEEVLRELGGVTKVAALTRSSKSAVCNWRHGGLFPARHYFRMHDRLTELGCVAERRLWAFTGLEEQSVIDVAA